MIIQNLRRELAVLKSQKDGCCTYCHRPFGSLIRWHKRSRYLEEQADHVIPRAIGGKITVPCCQVCNAIKGSMVFDSLADVQDYCLEILLKDKSVVLQYAQNIIVKRSVLSEALSDQQLLDWQRDERPSPTSETSHSLQDVRASNGLVTRRLATGKSRSGTSRWTRKLDSLITKLHATKGFKRRPRLVKDTSLTVYNLPAPRSKRHR